MNAPATSRMTFSAARRGILLDTSCIEVPWCVVASSVHPGSTVDVQRVTCHVLGTTGTEVVSRIGDLGGETEAAQRDAGRKFRPALLWNHGAFNRAGDDRVDAHT